MTAILTLPNFLSILRIPLALCLFINCPTVRFSAVFAAMVTDVLDGYIARRRAQISKLGTLLDPITDKLFVLTALAIFFFSEKISSFELVAFLARDISLVFFSFFLWLVGGWQRFTIRAFYCGKIVTTLQFLSLLGLCLNYEVPVWLYIVMGAFGVLSFFELLSIYINTKAQ